jgi:hypothetical protein
MDGTLTTPAEVINHFRRKYQTIANSMRAYSARYLVADNEVGRCEGSVGFAVDAPK